MQGNRCEGKTPTPTPNPIAVRSKPIKNFTSSRYGSLIERQTLINAPQTRLVAEHRSRPDSLSDDHSGPAPLLPIPNRTVKRPRANDSVVLPCESRSSSDPLPSKTPRQQWWGVFAQRGDNRRAPCLTSGQNGSLAQPVEQRTLNPFVAGSIPARPTNIINVLRLNSVGHFYFVGRRWGIAKSKTSTLQHNSPVK